MHRLIAGKWVLVALLSFGCAPIALDDDADYVHRLRIKITHVRHAIDETRRAMAESRGAKHLPELYVRVAELLSEEASYHYRLAYEREGRQSRVLHVPQVRLLKEEAVATYRKVLREHPDTELVDRILFNIGHEHRELARYDDMTEVLLKLVDQHPNSHLRNEALIVLGDYHFDRGRMVPARELYQRVVTAPPSAVQSLAWYKLAWVEMNDGECKAALGAFENAIARAKAETALPQSEKAKRPASAQTLNVHREALIDLTYCYSTERPVDGSVLYFRGSAPDREAYVAALGRLIKRYEVTERVKGTVAAARELLRVGPADLTRLDDARVLYATIRQHKLWTRVGSDAAAILRVLVHTTRRGDIDEETRQSLSSEFERYARDVLTRAHEVAKKPPGAHLLPQIAVGYAAYLETFPNSPYRWQLHENHADVLFALKRYQDAGLHYAELARILEEGDARNNAQYDAVASFQRAIEQKSQRIVDRVVVRSGLRRAATALMPHPLPPKKARKVKFAVALTWFDEGRFDEAIDRFTALAWEYPQSKEADSAIHLVLEAYNSIGDYEGLMNAGKRFLAIGSPASEALKVDLKPIVAAAEQTFLDQISLQAAGDEGASYEILEDFANKNKGSSLGERALVNAFVAARAVGDNAKLYELAERLAGEYPESKSLPGMLVALAQLSSASFDLERGIEYLRKAAVANPTSRVRLLVGAGELMEQIGDAKGALGVYREALKAAGDSPAAQRPIGRMAALLERVESPGSVVGELKPLAASGNPELLARVGLAEVRLGRIDAAEMTLQGVIGATTPASLDARARARYGAAESLLSALKGFDDPGDIDSFQEYVTLAEVAEQSYVTAAQLGHPLITAAALGRLAHLADTVRTLLTRVGPPPGLSAGERAAVRKALEGRVENLKAVSAEALAACTRQAWRGKVFNAAVRACLEGAPAGDPIGFDRLKSRPSVRVTGLKDARARLSRNPEDLNALRDLATRMLDGGDAHSARVVLARIVTVGGGPNDQNLLGIADHRAGDTTGALEAFARAADGGLEAGRQNLAQLLRELGLTAPAKRALNNWPVGRIGGRRLGASGGGS